MNDTAQKILTKGVLALDWSPTTIAKKFSEVNLVSTPELNRQYRQMLLTTPGIENYISAVILHEETINQKMDSGVSFVEYLSSLGIVAGVRGDNGGGKFTNSEEEITLGIEDLDARLKNFASLGIKFSKWRSCFTITDIYPSDEFLEENLNLLVKFAQISQANGLVPFIEPEITMNGRHTTTRCAEVTTDVLTFLFEKLKVAEVDNTKLILKTNMVLPGRESGVKAAPLEVAEATLRTLRKSVPSNVPGIVFLSGGQSPDEATNNLNEIAKRKSNESWKLSFSYARALQEEALNVWHGDAVNIGLAQQALVSRLEKVSKARMGGL